MHEEQFSCQGGIAVSLQEELRNSRIIQHKVFTSVSEDLPSAWSREHQMSSLTCDCVELERSLQSDSTFSS